jgi:flagellar export protein FliJ
MAPAHTQQFRLATLLRYRKQIVEERQQELQRLEQRLRDEQAAFERLHQRMIALHGVIHTAQLAGALDCEDLLHKFRHLEEVKQRTAQQAVKVHEASAGVEAQRERLLVALQDRQVLEKLQERQMAEFRQEETRKESHVLDEIGSVRFHRNLQEQARATRERTANDEQ